MGAPVTDVGAAAPRPALPARALVAALAVAPWLGLLAGRGAPSAAGLLGHAVALVAALHGAGAAVAWAAGEQRHGGVWLRVAWGAAAMIAAGGALMMFGGLTSAGQTALLYLGAIAHSGELVLRARRIAAELTAALSGAHRARWLLLVFAIGAIALLHLLGGVGAVARAPWDGETHLLGQLRLLADRGGLGDAVGFPRAQQLGGAVVLSALAGLDELRWAYMLDGIGLALLLALVSARLATLEEEGPLWTGLLVLVAMTFARGTFDAALFWMAAALLLAGAMSLEGALGDAGRAAPRRAIPAVLIAGALIVLHHALLPCGAVLLFAALWPQRRRAVGLLALAALALVIVAPYVIERSRAAASLPAAVRALIAPPGGFSVGRLALFALITALAVPLLRWLFDADRRAPDDLDEASASSTPSTASAATSAARWFALALAAGFAAGLSQLWVTRPYASRYPLTFALVMMAVAAVRAARPDRLVRSLPLRSAILSLLLLVSLYDAQELRAGRRWSARWAELGNAAGYVLITGAAATSWPPSPANAALAQVPVGATVAIWLGHPEQLDHSRHHILDLRTPFIARLRERSPARFERLLALIAPDYLLHEGTLPDRATLAGRLCLTSSACGDELSPIAQQHRVIWSGEGVRLLDLGR